MSTGISGSETRFTGDDDPALQYKPVSTMAVISLLLGIASTSSYFLLPALIIAPLALLIAAVTSYQLERARREYTGQLLAKIGLLLSVVSLVGPPTIYLTKAFILGAESRIVADRYIDLLLENKLKSAFPLTQTMFVQASASDDADVIRRSGRDPYVMFLASAPVALLGGKGEKVQVSHTANLYSGLDKGVELMMHQYIITIDADKPGDPPAVWSVPVFMQGAAAPKGQWEGRKWRIDVVYPAPYEPNVNRRELINKSGG